MYHRYMGSLHYKYQLVHIYHHKSLLDNDIDMSYQHLNMNHHLNLKPNKIGKILVVFAERFFFNSYMDLESMDLDLGKLVR